MHAGYDEAFIDRAMPGLTITLPLIAGDYVRVAQDTSGDVVGVVAVTNTALQGIALLYRSYVDPAHWNGRLLFGAAVARAEELKAGALMIYAEPSAESFYNRWERSGSVRGHFSIRRKSSCPTSCISSLETNEACDRSAHVRMAHSVRAGIQPARKLSGDKLPSMPTEPHRAKNLSSRLNSRR